MTRLGPPKRASRLSSDSLETPSESDTPPNPDHPVSLLSTIPSSGTEEVKGLRGLIQLQHQVGSLNLNGQYTPPASQTTPPSAQPRVPVGYDREATPIGERDPSPRVTPHESFRRTSSSSSTSSTSREGSVSRSLGRSSLRHLLATTTPAREMADAIEGVQKGLEALNARKVERDDEIPPSAIKAVSPRQISSHRESPEQQRQTTGRTSSERDITQEYIPPPGTVINTLSARRKSSPPHPKLIPRSSPLATQPPRQLSPVDQPLHSVKSLEPVQSQRPSSPIRPAQHQQVSPAFDKPPKMRVLDPDKSQSPKKLKAIITVNNRPYTRLSTIGRGGSSKVYKVISPQTNKIYALKKVSFDKADASAIMGYKNEIRLLNRMAERGGESKCIRLFDWESCDEKGYLLMVFTHRVGD